MRWLPPRQIDYQNIMRTLRTWKVMSSRCRLITSLLQQGKTMPTHLALVEKIVPNIQAEALR